MVSERQKRSLEFFKNKVVTFFVPAINRNFDEKQSIDYFVGKVVSLDDAGIWFEHPSNKFMNFIFYDKIISISEEQVLVESDPEQNGESFDEQEINPNIEKDQVQHLENAEQLDQIKFQNLPNNISDFKKLVSGS